MGRGSESSLIGELVDVEGDFSSFAPDCFLLVIRD